MLSQKIGYRNSSMSKSSKNKFCSKRYSLHYHVQRISHKCQEANDQLNSALNTSIDSISYEPGNEDIDDTSKTEPE